MAITRISIKKYPGGTNSVSAKKVVKKTYKPIDTYSRETTTQYEDSPEKKGKLYIKEGTVQRKPSGKGVDFIPDDTNKSVTSTGKVIDPRSKKVEADSQANLRRKVLDFNKDRDFNKIYDADLGRTYKQGDYITYETDKGTQVAGKLEKGADTPPAYSTAKVKEISISKRGDVRDSKGRSDLAKQYKAEGYVNQPGTYKYIKPDESKFVPETEVDQYIKQGYYRSDRAKTEVEKLKKGVKKMKLYKKRF
jgi:hypothetical protein